MTKAHNFVRKNLVVDPAKVRSLAEFKGTSESEAVRQAVDFVLAAEEITAAIRELRELGGIDDVFGKLPLEDDTGAAASGT